MNEYRTALENPEIVAAHLANIAIERRLPVREDSQTGRPVAPPTFLMMPDLVDYYFEVLHEVQQMEPHEDALSVV